MLNNLISNINSTPHKVPLPFNRDYRPDVFNIDSIIFVSVAKNYVRNPNGTHLVRTCFILVFFADIQTSEKDSTFNASLLFRL